MWHLATAYCARPAALAWRKPGVSAGNGLFSRRVCVFRIPARFLLVYWIENATADGWAARWWWLVEWNGCQARKPDLRLANLCGVSVVMDFITRGACKTQQTDGNWRKKRRAMSLESSQSDLGGSDNLDSTDPSGYMAGETAAFEPLFETAIFDRFDRDMDERIDQLINRWVHLAAPNAGRGRRLFAADRQTTARRRLRKTNRKQSAVPLAERHASAAMRRHPNRADLRGPLKT